MKKFIKKRWPWLAGGCVSLSPYMAEDSEGERGHKLSPGGSSYKGC